MALSKSLLYKTLRGESAPVIRRKLQKRDTDEQVEASMKKHFAEWSAIDADIRLVNGMTLRERMCKDKRDAKMNKARLSTTYWKNLRAEYTPEDKRPHK